MKLNMPLVGSLVVALTVQSGWAVPQPLVVSGTTNISSSITPFGVLVQPAGTLNILGGGSVNSNARITNNGSVSISSGGAFTGVVLANNTSNFNILAGGRASFSNFNNSGWLKVDGSFSVPVLNNQAGGIISGSGVITGAVVNLLSGSSLRPGDSPGTLPFVGSGTMNGGANTMLEVNDFAGTSGANPGWDLATFSGVLDIAATSGNPFLVDLSSLNGLVAGNAANFNPASSYSLVFVTAAGGISNFVANKFSVDTSGFSNAFNGAWSVGQSGNSLTLDYVGVALPEPSSLALLGLGAVLVLRLRQRC